VLHDTVEHVKNQPSGDAALFQSAEQEASTTVISVEQALQLFVRVVAQTAPGELRAALMPYANECMAVSQFFSLKASIISDEWPWTQPQWRSRAAALQVHSAELTNRVEDALR
jgi:hypothetical protein